MAIKTILRMGDLRLYRVAEVVEDIQADFIPEIIADMYDTARVHHGAGIAAPQLAYDYRIILFGLPTSRYIGADLVPETVLINPEIKILSNETENYWEGCLSVPGIRGLVSRPNHIFYRGYTPLGELIEREVKGFHARVVQHELDHLDGILFPSRVKNARLLAFEEVEGFAELKQRVQEGEFV